MAEIKDNISDEDIEILNGILQPLNKNPQNSEELNPMAKTFRQKMGYAEPIEFSDSNGAGGEEGEGGDSSASPFLDESDDLSTDDVFSDLPDENE
ncbi:MAG: hypothetical protein JJT78_15755, partial [Leptospira sp.]|nr:hypothetical protein [Leptospira sp.]